jgi:hypothetical protein
MRDHSKVKHVVYNNRLWEVTTFSTERRVDGDTFYTLKEISSKGNAVIVPRVNSKLCTPTDISKLWGKTLKGMEFGKMKTEPDEITEEDIDKAIEDSLVYQEANKWLRQQIAYGLRKYPEPLQHTTWNFKESIKHALLENSDKQHYLSMMYIKADYMFDIDEVIKLIEGIKYHEVPYAKLNDTLEGLKKRKQELVQLYESID